MRACACATSALAVAQAARLRASACARSVVQRAFGDEALLATAAPGARPRAAAVGGQRAGLGDALARGVHLRAAPAPARACWSSFHSFISNWPFLHPVALLHRQHLDAAAGDGRQLGALAGLDRAGAGVGDGGLDRAAADAGGEHGHRLGPAQPPQQRCRPAPAAAARSMPDATKSSQWLQACAADPGTAPCAKLSRRGCSVP